MGFYRHIVRGLIGVGFCALFAGCGAADPESAETDVNETEALCTGVPLFVCVKYSETNLNGRCCICNSHAGTLRPDLIMPNTYKCKS